MTRVDRAHPCGDAPADAGVPTIRMFGIRLSTLGLADTIALLDTRIRERRVRTCVFTANVDHIVRLAKDGAFRRCYRRANLVTADGTPVVWVARLLGLALKERVTGIDLLLQMCCLAEQRNYSVFFLGATGEVLQEAMASLVARYPRLHIAGAQDGYFEDDERVVALIRAADPDILFLGMGSPRQEAWIATHFDRLTCRVAMPVGGSFDVVSGKRPRAPAIVQKAGMEWAWRLCQEPLRLAPRYLLYDLWFFYLVLRECIERL